MNRTMTTDLDRHITGNYGEDQFAPAPGECIWEDCDQDAIYCQGHALEFANVSSEHEATRLRAERDELLAALTNLVECQHGEAGWDCLYCNRAAIEAARAAIAKCEGGAK